MKKRIIITILMIVLTGCSRSEPELNPPKTISSEGLSMKSPQENNTSEIINCKIF